LFLSEGLPQLILYLDRIRQLPETALTSNHALQMRYWVEEGTLTTQESSGGAAGP